VREGVSGVIAKEFGCNLFEQAVTETYLEQLKRSRKDNLDRIHSKTLKSLS
jgi:hypothetical protein